jgi:hypothetical protein
MKKRSKKEQRKLALELVRQKVEQIRTKLESMNEVEESLWQQRLELKSLSGQLFSERVNLIISTQVNFPKPL